MVQMPAQNADRCTLANLIFMSQQVLGEYEMEILLKATRVEQ